MPQSKPISKKPPVPSHIVKRPFPAPLKLPRMCSTGRADILAAMGGKHGPNLQFTITYFPFDSDKPRTEICSGATIQFIKKHLAKPNSVKIIQAKQPKYK